MIFAVDHPLCDVWNSLIGVQDFCWPKFINQLGQKLAFGRFLSCVGMNFNRLYMRKNIQNLENLIHNQKHYSCSKKNIANLVNEKNRQILNFMLIFILNLIKFDCAILHLNPRPWNETGANLTSMYKLCHLSQL